jgi:iron-sulfur cluster assembly protein
MAEGQIPSTKEGPALVDLTLTDSAIRQVKALLARDKLEGHGLRVAVTGGGCSGFSYQLNFERDEKPGDLILDIDNLKVFVDSASAPLLQGSVIDFVAGLHGGGFRFSNPNATGTCGCGTSFSA